MTTPPRDNPAENEFDVTLADPRVSPSEFAHALLNAERLLLTIAQDVDHVPNSVRVELADLWPGSAHARMRVVASPDSITPTSPPEIVRRAKHIFKQANRPTEDLSALSTRTLQLVKQVASAERAPVYKFDDEVVRFDKQTVSHLKTALAPTAHRYGSLEGRLKEIVRGGGYVTTARKLRAALSVRFSDLKVRCVVPPALEEKVRSGFNKRVRVFGVIGWRDEDPLVIEVEDLDVLPSPHEIPTWQEMAGIAKGWPVPTTEDDE